MSANSGRVGYPVPVTAEVIAGQDPDGRVRVLTLDADGNLNTTGGGGGGGGAVTIADGADVTQGAIADPAVLGDNAGTVKAALRGLAQIWNDVWDSINHRIKVDGSGVTQPVTGPLTDAQLRASAVPVSGTVATGGLTDTQLRATPVPVSGTVTASGPLTDTQLRATAVPVSGTVTASGPLTDTQLRASAVPVSLATAPTTAVTIADGASVTLGAKADAKSTATDTTPITAMSVWKQISSSVQALVTGTVLAAGSALVGKFSIDQVTAGANQVAETFDPNLLTRRDNYTSAQTDTKLVTVSAGSRVVVYACTITCDAAGTTKPTVRAGFAATNTPTGAGTYISHPGLSPGSGVAERWPIVGADGEDFIFTCAVPTGGSIDVVTKYKTVTP